jgi:putative restriction endonuclease
MKFWVGITDKDWFDYLSAGSPDEVNFWQPSARPVAQFLEPGSLFLFKLHAPRNYIVGGGIFVRFSVLPAKLAWLAFGTKNGVESYSDLRARVERYRAVTHHPSRP